MTRREFVRGLGAAGLVAATPAGVAGGAATEPIEASKAWFREAQFGMMSHFGLYTVAAGEWNGLRSGSYSEWLMWRRKIPFAEYARLAQAFNPVFFDPLDWAKRMRDAGVKYYTVTAKHHEGFALFRSQVSRYNVVDATPFRRDVIGEIAEACRTVGIRLGLYYSQAVDWSERDGSGYLNPHHDSKALGEPRTWANDWDWPDASTKDYARCFESKIKPQVDELLTQYGDLALIWFDTPVGMKPEQSDELWQLVRRRQPGCLVNSRIGNGRGDYSSSGDNAEPEESDRGKLFEMVGSINHSFGYRPSDTADKTADEVRKLRARCRSYGANYLLNFAPDHLGRMSAAVCDLLAQLQSGK